MTVTRPLRILFCEPRIPNNTGATMRLAAVTGAELHRHEDTHDAMPVQDGTLTTREVRAEAGAVLPGARVRRLLFFRYLLVWQKPR